MPYCPFRVLRSSSFSDLLQVPALTLFWFQLFLLSCSKYLELSSIHQVHSTLSGDTSEQTFTTQPLHGSIDLVRDNLGEPVPEGTFRHLLDFLEQNEDNTDRCTSNLDGLPPHPD